MDSTAILQQQQQETTSLDADQSSPSPSPSSEDNSIELQQKIDLIRENFLKEYYEDPKLFYENDIELIKTNPWWIERFLKWNKFNIEKSLKQMLLAFKWRKSFGINDRTAKDLPIEFAKSGAIFPLGEDYKGRPLVYIRVKVHKKLPKLNEYFKQFVAGVLDFVDRKSDRRGYVLIFDYTGFGWGNIDLEFLQFITQLVQNYYPYGLRYAICHNLPKFLLPFTSMFKLIVGSNAEKTLKFTNTTEELLKFIPEDFLPKYLGGQCRKDFTEHEELKDSPSVRDLAEKFGFTQKEVDKYFKLFEPTMEETRRLVMGE